MRLGRSAVRFGRDNFAIRWAERTTSGEMTVAEFIHQPLRFSEGLMTETYSQISQEPCEQDPILDPTDANCRPTANISAII